MSRLNGHVYSMTRGAGVHDPLSPVVYQHSHRVAVDGISSFCPIKRVFEVTRVVRRNSECDNGVSDTCVSEETSRDLNQSLCIPSATVSPMSAADNNQSSISLERCLPLSGILQKDIKHSPSEVQSRFRIVKIESRELFKRGRWTCRDFADPPEAKSSEAKALLKTGSNSPTNPVFYVPGASDDLASSQLIFYSEGHPVLDSDTLPCTSKLLIGELATAMDTGPSSMSMCQTSASNSSTGAGSERTVGATADRGLNDIDGVWPEGQVEPSLLSLVIDENTEQSAASVGSTSEIDNKIEQAMDLVKQHLMLAVRAEVEELKEQIQDLLAKNNQLAYENSILRANADPELLATLDNLPSDSEYNSA